MLYCLIVSIYIGIVYLLGICSVASVNNIYYLFSIKKTCTHIFCPEICWEPLSLDQIHSWRADSFLRPPSLEVSAIRVSSGGFNWASVGTGGFRRLVRMGVPGVGGRPSLLAPKGEVRRAEDLSDSLRRSSVEVSYFLIFRLRNSNMSACLHADLYGDRLKNYEVTNLEFTFVKLAKIIKILDFVHEVPISPIRNMGSHFFFLFFCFLRGKY